MTLLSPALRLASVQPGNWPWSPPSEALLFLAGVVALGFLLWKLNSFSLKNRRLEAPFQVPADPDQRRADFRVPVSVPVEIFPTAGLALTGVLNDLSAGGAMIMVEGPLPAGSRLSLSFRVGGEAFERLDADILRKDPAPWNQRHYVHCRFRHPSPAEESRLLRAVARREQELLRPE